MVRTPFHHSADDLRTRTFDWLGRFSVSDRPMDRPLTHSPARATQTLPGVGARWWQRLGKFNNCPRSISLLNFGLVETRMGNGYAKENLTASAITILARFHLNNDLGLFHASYILRILGPATVFNPDINCWCFGTKINSGTISIASTRSGRLDGSLPRLLGRGRNDPS